MPSLGRTDPHGSADERMKTTTAHLLLLNSRPGGESCEHRVIDSVSPLRFGGTVAL